MLANEEHSKESEKVFDKLFNGSDKTGVLVRIE